MNNRNGSQIMNNRNASHYLTIPKHWARQNMDQTSVSGLYDENDQYNEHTPSVVVVVCSGYRRFQQFFRHITTMTGCDRELSAHIYCDVSLKYHVPDTWHDTTPSHIILTLPRPVLALPCKSDAKRGAACTILKTLVCRDPGSNCDLKFPDGDTLATELPGLVHHLFSDDDTVHAYASS